jgi:uncharacterized MAPEG superfamily protein
VLVVRSDYPKLIERDEIPGAGAGRRSTITEQGPILELISLLFAGALVWVSALIQHVNNVRSRGVPFVMSDRSAPLSDDGFTGRATRALRNNMESALMYVPVALVAVVSQEHSAVTYYVAAYWMLSRSTFTLGYWFKVNLLRSLSWSTGMLAIAILAVHTVLRLIAS